LINRLCPFSLGEGVGDEVFSTELIKWDYKLAHGIYQPEVTRPDGRVKDINVLY
jgi:hypothetical protein